MSGTAPLASHTAGLAKAATTVGTKVTSMGSTVVVSSAAGKSIAPGITTYSLKPCHQCLSVAPTVELDGKKYCSSCETQRMDEWVAFTKEQVRVASRHRNRCSRPWRVPHATAPASAKVCFDGTHEQIGRIGRHGAICVVFRDKLVTPEDGLTCSKCGSVQLKAITYDMDLYAETSSLVPKGLFSCSSQN